MTEPQPTAYNDGTTPYNNKPTTYNNKPTAYNNKPTTHNKYYMYHIRQLWRSMSAHECYNFKGLIDQVMFTNLHKKM